MAGRVHDACGQRGRAPGAGQQRAVSLHGLRRLSRLSTLFAHTCFLRLLELDCRLLPRETHSYDMLHSGWVHHPLRLSCFQSGSRRSEANRCVARHESTLWSRRPRTPGRAHRRTWTPCTSLLEERAMTPGTMLSHPCKPCTRMVLCGSLVNKGKPEMTC